MVGSFVLFRNQKRFSAKITDNAPSRGDSARVTFYRERHAMERRPGAADETHERVQGCGRTTSPAQGSKFIAGQCSAGVKCELALPGSVGQAASSLRDL